MLAKQEITIDRIFGTNLSTNKSYEPEAPIYQLGDLARDLHFVQSGIVVIRNTDLEDMNIIDIARQGDVFGADVFLGESRIHAAEAHREVEVASISRRKIELLLATLPSAALPILKSISQAHRRAEEYANLMKRGLANSKVSSAILDFREGDTVYISHRKIAQRAGVHRIGVTRVIGELQNSGALSVAPHREVIKIGDLDLLRENANYISEDRKKM